MRKNPDPSVGDGIDAQPDPTPNGFDLASWIAGVQPVRRRVTIYGRGDLQAPIDELSQAEALAVGAERERLQEKLRELTAELQASGVVFEIEGRTSTWVTKFYAEMTDEGVPEADRNLALLAAQIVSPPVTLDDMRALNEVREADVLRLVNVAVDANTRPITLDPRFLPAASD